jgi:uncharacterized protein
VIWLVLAGTAGGILTGLTGANGVGVLMSVLLLGGNDPRAAVALTLVAQLFTMSAALVPILRVARPSLASWLWLAVPAMGGAWAGARGSHAIPEDWIRGLLIVGLVVVGGMLLRSKPRKEPEEPAKAARSSRGALGLPLLGGLSGLLAGLVGGGGNIIVTNALYGGLGVPFRQALGLSMGLGALSAAVGATTYFLSGDVLASQIPWIAAPALVSAGLTARLSLRVSVPRIRRMQGLYLLAAAALIAVRALAV